MPTGNTSVNTDTVKSLRSLTTTATVTHFFDKDKTLLPKVYQHGILPVKVINEIYCQWARQALEKSKAEVKLSYDKWAKAWMEMSLAKYDLTAQQLKYFRNKPLENYLQDLWTRKTAISQANYEAFNKIRSENHEKLQAIDAIFGVTQRFDIIAETEDWEIQDIHKEIDDQIAEGIKLSNAAKSLAESNPNSLVN